jgi:N-methylhydantoinase B
MRGGVSGENAITPYGTDELNVVVSTLTTNHTSSTGLNGGYSGGGSQSLLKRDTAVLDKMNQNGLVPRNWQDIPGETEVLPAKHAIVLRPGDVFNGVPPGGGGFLDPLTRSAQSVAYDVREGTVSVQCALEIYGVSVDQGAGVADEEITSSNRIEMRKQRLRDVGRDDDRLREPRKNWSKQRNAGHRLGEAMQVCDGHVFCARCDEKFTLASDNPKQHVPVRRRELGSLGPWVAMRWGGESPDFEWVEYICPGCGYLIDANLRKKSEPEPWHDYLLQQDQI